MKEDRALVCLQGADRLIAEATTIVRAKDAKDTFRAIEVWARRAKKGPEIVAKAIEYQLRLERRMGGIIGDMKERGEIREGRPSRKRCQNGTVSKTLAEMGVGKKESSRAQRLFAVSQETFDECLAVAKDRKALDAGIQVIKRQDRAEPKDSPPLPEGTYAVIVVDPPWSYGRKEDITHRGSCPYHQMTIEEISAIDVRSISAKDGVLWLWTTNSWIEDSFALVRGWGFEPKTILTWFKNKMGLGDWLRGKTEHCILGVRGRPAWKVTNQSTALEAPSREHSRKPDEFFALVEALSPGPYVELFSRETRKGWAQHGNQKGLMDG